jgi:Zn-dependent oligopeptidase
MSIKEMIDANDTAKAQLAKLVGNGIEYQSYCTNQLAGDFACDTMKIVDALTELAQRAEARVKRLEETIRGALRIKELWGPSITGDVMENRALYSMQRSFEELVK